MGDSRKYGVPLYCAGWVEPISPKEEGKEKNKEDVTDLGAQPSQSKNRYVVFGGGGGEARSGIKNSLLLAVCDAECSKLCDPVVTVSTENNTPYRMAMHPHYQRMICAFENSCRLFKISELPDVRLEAEEFDLSKLQGTGQQLALAFNSDGSAFATGGEDGHLRVFEWPSMNIIIDRPDAHKSFKDLDFSLDGSFLASTGDGAPCRIWDISNANPVASLNLQRAGLCRFSRDATEEPYLFIVALQDDKSYLTTWSTTTWSKVRSKELEEKTSAFAISCNGMLLAVGSSEGNISILNSGMVVLKRIKRAHMIFVTAMTFSPDSRALLSVSGDSSARVTFHDTGHQQGSPWRIMPLLSILIGLVLFIAVILKVAESLQNSLDFVQDPQVNDMFVD